MFRDGQPLSLRAMLEELRRIYCGTTGYEFMHIHAPEVREWLERVTMERFISKEELAGAL